MVFQRLNPSTNRPSILVKYRNKTEGTGAIAKKETLPHRLTPDAMMHRAQNASIDRFRDRIQTSTLSDLLKTNANGLTILDYVLKSINSMECTEILNLLFRRIDHSYEALCLHAAHLQVKWVEEAPKKHDLLLVNPGHLVHAIRFLKMPHIELLVKHALNYGFSFDSPHASPIVQAIFFTDSHEVKRFFESIGVFANHGVQANPLTRSESLLSSASTICYDELRPNNGVKTLAVHDVSQISNRIRSSV